MLEKNTALVFLLQDADILGCWYPTNTTVGYILIIGVVKDYRRHGVGKMFNYIISKADSKILGFEYLKNPE